MVNTFKKALGFTLLELMVVISVLAILMGMIASVVPNTAQVETVSLITRLRMAVEIYRDNFFSYPRAKENMYWLDSGQEVTELNFFQMLAAKDVTRRDGKYIDQLYVPESEVEYDTFDGEDYFVDGWGEKIVYYSGIEVAINSPENLPLMLEASGAEENVQKNIDSLTKLYRPGDYFFLGSAGRDNEFYYQVVAGQSHDPEDYRYGIPFSGQMSSGQGEDDDDIWNYNLNSQ